MENIHFHSHINLYYGYSYSSFYLDLSIYQSYNYVIEFLSIFLTKYTVLFPNTFVSNLQYFTDYLNSEVKHKDKKMFDIVLILYSVNLNQDQMVILMAAKVDSYDGVVKETVINVLGLLMFVGQGCSKNGGESVLGCSLLCFMVVFGFS